MQSTALAKPSPSSTAKIASGVILGTQLGIFLITYAAAPAYISGLINNPIGLTLLFGAIAWELLGLWFASLPAGPVATGVKWSAVTVFCIVPMLLMPMIGPAVVTITQAIGPVLR